MAQKDFVQPHRAGCTVAIDASPGAKVTEIVGVNKWRGSLQVRIAAEAQGGAANDELMRFLSHRLSIARTSITIMKGEKSGRKTLLLPLDADRVRSLLAGG
jgi:uncharacterized protein (TIGR00251 family)